MAIRVLSSKTGPEIVAKNLTRQARKRRTPTPPQTIQPIHIIKSEKVK